MSFLRGRAVRGVLRAGRSAAVALLIATAALALEFGSHNGTGLLALSGRGTAAPPASAGLSAATPGSFSISGSVSGLYPGGIVPLVLTVTNPQHFPIIVTSLSTAAGSASAACVASNLSVTPFSGQLPVPAGGTARTTVQVSMAHSAPDACKAAIFPLTYSGQARKAG